VGSKDRRYYHCGSDKEGVIKAKKTTDDTPGAGEGSGNSGDSLNDSPHTIVLAKLIHGRREGGLKIEKKKKSTHKGCNQKMDGQ